ncbi:hypothetical protein [Kaarinaea lacus]
MLNQYFKSFIYGGLLILLNTGCSSEPEFTRNETINATHGKPAAAKVNVSNWSNKDQLVLMPGGPYADNHFPVTHPVKFIRATGERVAVVDKQNQLVIADFSSQPAQSVAQFDLADQVTAMSLYGELLIVGLKKQGLTLFDLSKLPTIRKIGQFELVKSVTQIRVSGDKVYALINDRQLWVLQQSNVSSAEAQWQHVDTIDLPAPSIDFAIVGKHVITIGAGYGIGTLLLSDPQQFRSTVRLQNRPKRLHVAESVAYVAGGKTGLVLFNIENPDRLQWLGSHNKFDAVDDVITSGNRAFVVDRGIRLATLNISNKALPITDSFYKPASPINGFIVVEDKVYLATKLSIERVRFPAQSHTQISNEGINQGGSRRAFIDNNIAYVADWFSGLHLYDISDPTHLRHIGNYHTPGSSKGVVVDNGYAYVGDDDHGLQIIDVRNPKQPVKVSEIMTTGLAYTLKKQGNLVYLADHRGGFHIIDVTNIQSPRLLSSYDTPGKSWAIDVVDNVAYVADDTSGLLVFDVHNTKQPRQIGQFNPQGAAEDVVVKDNLAFVSFFDKGLYILDVSKPSQPAILSQLQIPGNARSIVIDGSHAYIAGWESGLNIVDISDAKAPHIVGRYDTKGSAWGADVSNGHVYIWDWWGGVVALNIENPLQPQLTDKYHARGQIINLREKGNYIYTANDIGGVQTFDINNPLNPIWVTGIDFPGNVVDIWPSTGKPFAFAANAEHGLRVLDISNPFYIRAVGQYNTGGHAVLVREHNNTVYVANKKTGLVIYNASNPHQLVKQRELPLLVKDIWLTENRMLAVSQERDLLAFTIDESGVPAKNYKVIDNNTERVIADRTTIVSATGDNKIKIWRITKDSYELTSTIVLDEPVVDVQLAEQLLLVNTAQRGLLSYDITEPAQPVLQTRYPATDALGRFIVDGDAVFFGGTHTIASVQRLPPLEWKRLNISQLEVAIPGNLDTGYYHLLVVSPQGYEQLWPNAIKVSLPQRTKPKMTMDDFKRLLEQHRSAQQ